MSLWSGWSRCDKACTAPDLVRGQQHRTRSVVQKDNGAKGAITCGNETEMKPCNDHRCPINCETGDWGSWNNCSVSCGGGHQTRRRNVTVNADHGGAVCPGLVQTQACNVGACPRDCVVGAWGSYSHCTKSCNTGGAGTKFATRLVLQQAANGGDSCDKFIDAAAGETERTKTVECNDRPCPSDCQVHPWSSWTTCSMSCNDTLVEHAKRGATGHPKLGWHARTRQLVSGGGAEYGGRGCPALYQRGWCNSYPECMAL